MKEFFKKKMSVTATVIVLLLFGIAYAGLYWIDHAAVIVDTSEAPAEYLPLDDYVLYDNEGKAQFSLKNPFFENRYDFYYEATLHTTKGFRNGMSFEEFVDTYGDYYAAEMDLFDLEDDREAEDYYDTHYRRNAKVRDLAQYFIDSGIRPETVTFYFKTHVRFNEIAYSERQMDVMSDHFFGTSWPEGGIFNPYVQIYELSFSFSRETDYHCVNIGVHKYVWD